MVGAATLKGQTAEQILAAKVADKEVGSLNDPSKVFFFYNVKRASSSAWEAIGVCTLR